MSTFLLFLLLIGLQTGPDDPVGRGADTSATAVVITDSREAYDVGPHVAVLVDRGKGWSFSEVVSSALPFEPHPKKTPSFGYSSAVYWLRFTVEMQSEGDWLLEVAEKSLDHVEFRTSLDDSQVLTAGDGLPFYSRPVHQRRLLFPLPNAPQYEVYLRAHTQGPAEFPLRIWSEDALARESRKEEFALGIFFGILLIMAVYNLVLFASLRDVSYLFFALFIASFAFYQASVERIAFEYLWPDSLWWMDRANSLLAVFCAGWAVLFTRSFLDTRLYTPMLDRVLVALVGVCVILLGFIAVGPARVINQVVVYFFILMAPVILVSAIACVINRDRAAVYYLMGWTILLIGVPAGMFGYLGFLSEQISGVASVRFAAFTGIVLLSQIGLGYRYDQMRREREELRLRIARDLHDEIGSGLTEISLYGELIQRASQGKVSEWAGDMGRQAREMTGKMQDMVWVINPRQEGWSNLELRMKDFSSRLLAPQNIAFDMRGDVQHDHENLSLEVRKNLLLIYKEIIHNAVRHAECTRITVRYELTRKSLRMRICDDGRGFDPECVKENNGLRNVRERSREIGADLSLETTPGGPTCYEISMPIVRTT